MADRYAHVKETEIHFCEWYYSSSDEYEEINLNLNNKKKLEISPEIFFSLNQILNLSDNDINESENNYFEFFSDEDNSSELYFIENEESTAITVQKNSSILLYSSSSSFFEEEENFEKSLKNSLLNQINIFQNEQKSIKLEVTVHELNINNIIEDNLMTLNLVENNISEKFENNNISNENFNIKNNEFNNIPEYPIIETSSEFLTEEKDFINNNNYKFPNIILNNNQNSNLIDEINYFNQSFQLNDEEEPKIKDIFLLPENFLKKYNEFKIIDCNFDSYLFPDLFQYIISGKKRFFSEGTQRISSIISLNYILNIPKPIKSNFFNLKIFFTNDQNLKIGNLLFISFIYSKKTPGKYKPKNIQEIIIHFPICSPLNLHFEFLANGIRIAETILPIIEGRIIKDGKHILQFSQNPQNNCIITNKVSGFFKKNNFPSLELTFKQVNKKDSKKLSILNDFSIISIISIDLFIYFFEVLSIKSLNIHQFQLLSFFNIILKDFNLLKSANKILISFKEHNNKLKNLLFIIKELVFSNSQPFNTNEIIHFYNSSQFNNVFYNNFS